MKKMTKLYQAGGATSPESSKKRTRKRVIKKQKLQEGITKRFGKEIEDLGYKKGGSVKNAKLAAMAAPKNKITRADIITAAKKKAKKK